MILKQYDMPFWAHVQWDGRATLFAPAGITTYEISGLHSTSYARTRIILPTYFDHIKKIHLGFL